MDRSRICRQLIEFQKVTFDNSYDGLSKLQEQSEAMINTFLAQSHWLPNDGRKAFTDWLEAFKQARSDFKETVDESFEKVMEYFDCGEHERHGDSQDSKIGKDNHLKDKPQ
jgi:hypothetical protein